MDVQVTSKKSPPNYLGIDSNGYASVKVFPLESDDDDISSGSNRAVSVNLNYDYCKLNDKWERAISDKCDVNCYLSTYLLDGSAKDMAVDGSGTSVEYSYTVPASKELHLSRGFIVIEDGSTAFDPAKFGALNALSNGVEISITPSGESKVVMETWTTNREVRDTMFDFDRSFKSDGDYVGRWTFGKDLGNFSSRHPGVLLSASDKFSFLIQDDLSDLDYLSFKIKGRLRSV